MPLAAILGLCLLLPSWEGVNALLAVSVVQSTSSQSSETSNAASQNSVGTSPANQQKSPNQSPASPQPSTSTPTCPDNSQPAVGTKSDCKTSDSKGVKSKKHHRAHKAITPAATTPPPGGPAKTVVRNGGEADPAVDLSPAPSAEQASRLGGYNQLIAATDANLQKISGRQLTTSQEDTVKQIKSYMEQAKGAAQDGDGQRAYNLAVKANLLSAELAGQQ
jgi:hypothetical protein